jgi:hypothetical protein
MSPETIIALSGAVIIALTVFVVVLKFALRRAPQKLKKSKFQKQWRELQQYCKDKQTWPQALIAADELLDKALIKRGFKGKKTGERLVSAQRKFTDNDDVWFAHKLTRKVQEDPETKLKETDVKDALKAFAQALKDLGAL